MHFADERGQHRWQRLIGADIQRRLSHEILAQGHIEKWPGSLAHALILRVGGHAYDSRPAAFHLKPAADRILTAPVERHHGSVDDGNWRRVFIVGAGEVATGKKR